MSQPLEALALANEVYRSRAAAKREIKAMPPADGISAVTDLIVTNPPLWRTARLEQLLRAPFRVGSVTVHRWLNSAELSPRKQVGSLTERQRNVLVHVLLDVADHEDRQWRARKRLAA